MAKKKAAKRSAKKGSKKSKKRMFDCTIKATKKQKAAWRKTHKSLKGMPKKKIRVGTTKRKGAPKSARKGKIKLTNCKLDRA